MQFDPESKHAPKLCRSACILLFSVPSLAAGLQGARGAITLNEREYFEAPGFAFLVFHNSEAATRGGLQMMQNGEWLMASDNVQFTGPDPSVGVRGRPSHIG
jgi:hypothetical protein